MKYTSMCSCLICSTYYFIVLYGAKHINFTFLHPPIECTFVSLLGNIHLFSIHCSFNFFIFSLFAWAPLSLMRND